MALPNGDVIFHADKTAYRLQPGRARKAEKWLALPDEAHGLAAANTAQALIASHEGLFKVTGSDQLQLLSAKTISQHAVRLDNGTSYVTEYYAGSDPGLSRVVRIGSWGVKHTVVPPIDYPSGIATSPDQSLLYVADNRSHWVYSYQIQPGGCLEHKQKFYHLHAPDDDRQPSTGGMCCDADGRLYVATTLGVQVCDQAGRVNFILPLPDYAPARGVAITTGPEPTLVVTAGDKVFARKVKVPGALPSMPPTRPKPPRL